MSVQPCIERMYVRRLFYAGSGRSAGCSYGRTVEPAWNAVNGIWVCAAWWLVLAGEGNSDSAVTVIGLMAGAAFAHNFGLASGAEGPTVHGKVAVLTGIAVIAAIACLYTFKKKDS